MFSFGAMHCTIVLYFNCESNSMMSFNANMKRDLVAIFGASAIVSALAFLIALMKGMNVWSHSAQGSAFDVAMLAFGAVTLVTSMGGLIVSNFVFLGEKKNWRDFWSKEMLEYFLKPNVNARWRVARGRFILFSITFASGFLTFRGYSYLRNLVNMIDK